MNRQFRIVVSSVGFEVGVLGLGFVGLVSRLEGFGLGTSLHPYLCFEARDRKQELTCRWPSRAPLSGESGLSFGCFARFRV